MTGVRTESQTVVGRLVSSPVPDGPGEAAADEPPLDEGIGKAKTLVTQTFVMNFLVCVLSYIFLLCPFPTLVRDLGLAGSTLATRKAALPEPLFVESPWVDDYYAGDVFDAFDDAQYHANAFFMFYAPWDSDSIRARAVLDKVASIFEDHSDLFFGAVNCWSATGDCHKEFGAKKGHRRSDYPVFVFYPKNRRGIQYQGPITAVHLVKFLLNAETPLVILESKADLLELQARSGGQVLVAYFRGLGTTNVIISYRRFLKAAYDCLEVDPFRDKFGPFAVVVSPIAARSLQLNESQPLRLFLWNSSSVAFPNKTIASSASLVTWAWQHIANSQGPQWVGTSCVKSLRLAEYLVRGSGRSLMAFVPRAVGLRVDKKMSILHRIAASYLNGEANVCSTRHDHVHLSEVIANLSQKRDADLEETILACLEDPWFSTHFCLLHPDNCLCLAECSINRTDIRSRKFASGTRLGVASLPSLRKPAAKKTSIRYDHLTCALTAFQHGKEFCHLRDDVLSHALFEEDFDMELLDGVGTLSNETLNIYAADSETQSELAKSLGIQFNLDEKTYPVVIIDTIDEAVYEMEEAYSLNSVATFIHNFHYHKEKLRRLRLDLRPRRQHPKKNSLRLQEVSHTDFDAKVLRSPDNVVLLFTSSSCGMCASYAHVFHMVNHLLAGVANLTFVTVDSGRNDLPWHFTTLSVPSVLFFPRIQKSETRAFPAHKELSVPNLLSFIVANLDAKARWQVSMSLCDDACLQRALEALEKSADEEVNFRLSADDVEELESLFMQEERRRSLEAKSPSPVDATAIPENTKRLIEHLLEKSARGHDETHEEL